MPAQHDIAAETELWDTFAASAFKDDAEPSFCWTQYAGHGPGPELLGDPHRVLEIGCGIGRTLANLAERGIVARGVDLSPVMVEKTATKWNGTGAEFVERLLTRAGFATADARVLDAPQPGHIGTLLVRAVTP